MNESLLIQQLGQRNSLGDVLSSDTYSFFVSNISNEEMAFANAAFGLKVYYYDQDREIWDVLAMLTYPENQNKVLPADLDGLDVNFLNQWTIVFSRDLPANLPKNIRLFIAGRGEVSGKWYGAYVDIEIPSQ